MQRRDYVTIKKIIDEMTTTMQYAIVNQNNVKTSH